MKHSIIIAVLFTTYIVSVTYSKPTKEMQENRRPTDIEVEEQNMRDMEYFKEISETSNHKRVKRREGGAITANGCAENYARLYMKELRKYVCIPCDKTDICDYD